MLWRGTTIVQAGLPADPRTGALKIARNPVVPFRREQMPPEVPPVVARLLHQVQESMHDVTQHVRSLPEGGQRTYFKDVSFVAGADKTLSHLLGVHGDVTSQNVAGASAIVFDPEQIRFEVINQRVAAGACFRVAVDQRTITLRPSTTFTADVRLFVVP